MRLDVWNSRDEGANTQTIGNESQRYRQFGAFQLELIEEVWIVIRWEDATRPPTKIEALPTGGTTCDPVSNGAKRHERGHQKND